MDKNSFMQGHLLGCRLRGQRPEGKKPTAYSYNGTVLPPLPEVEGMPYALICHGLSKDYWFVYLGAEAFPYTASVLGSSIACDGDTYYRLVDGEWGYRATTTNSINIIGMDGVRETDIIWANHDLINSSDGSVYLAATEPIPVYE